MPFFINDKVQTLFIPKWIFLESDRILITISIWSRQLTEVYTCQHDTI